jgi:hypothetical protein
MSKQTKPITKQCQHRSQCSRDATIGTYAWSVGDSDVNLDKPLKVFCGQHKPRLRLNQRLRNVAIIR